MSAKKPNMAFALAGQVVRTETHARKILRKAILEGPAYLIPQARSVARQLAAAQGKAGGGAA